MNHFQHIGNRHTHPASPVDGLFQFLAPVERPVSAGVRTAGEVRHPGKTFCRDHQILAAGGNNSTQIAGHEYTHTQKFFQKISGSIQRVVVIFDQQSAADNDVFFIHKFYQKTIGFGHLFFKLPGIFAPAHVDIDQIAFGGGKFAFGYDIGTGFVSFTHNIYNIFGSQFGGPIRIIGYDHLKLHFVVFDQRYGFRHRRQHRCG